MNTPNPTDDAPFTTGEFSPNGQFKWEDGVIYCDSYWHGEFCKCATDRKEHDAKLIAAAMTSAGKLHRSGYDAQKVFEALAWLLPRAKLFLPPDCDAALKIEDLRRKPKP